MNILVVSHYFWPERFRINDLVLELKARGHSVSVLTGIPNYPVGKVFDGYSWWKKRREEIDGICVFRAPMVPRQRGRGWQLALNYLSFALFGCMFAPWYFRRTSFEVIFVYAPSPFTVGIPAALMRRLKKAPMMLWVQDLWPESLSAAGAVHSPQVLRLVGMMVRAIYRRCDRILVQSQAFVESVVAAGARRRRTVCFPNWAESFYQPVPASEGKDPAAGVPSSFRVMFAGNLGEAQSLETIVGAADLLRNEKGIQWLILGDGRRREWMEREVARLGLQSNVHFLGSFPAERMPEFFAVADAMLVTLKGDPVFSLTVPSKVQSYMACGRPIVGALNGEGARLVREAGAGLVAAADDVEGLAHAVLQLSRMSGTQRNNLGRCGRLYYEKHFERDMLIRRLEGWMREVIEEGVCES